MKRNFGRGMTLYTFHLRRAEGAPTGFEAEDFTSDGAAFEHAGALLEQHSSADHVEVWDAERDVVARFREQPLIRPVPQA